MKTHKSTSKRFRMTKGGNGKLMRTKQGKSHFRRKKPRRVRAQFARMLSEENGGVRRRIKRLMPFSGKNS
jgi:large subunit ribosomal protein L35